MRKDIQMKRLFGVRLLPQVLCITFIIVKVFKFNLGAINNSSKAPYTITGIFTRIKHVTMPHKSYIKRRCELHLIAIVKTCKKRHPAEFIAKKSSIKNLFMKKAWKVVKQFAVGVQTSSCYDQVHPKSHFKSAFTLFCVLMVT